MTNLVCSAPETGENLLEDYFIGELGSKAKEFEGHLQDCAFCRQQVADMTEQSMKYLSTLVPELPNRLAQQDAEDADRRRIPALR